MLISLSVSAATTFYDLLRAAQEARRRAEAWPPDRAAAWPRGLRERRRRDREGGGLPAGP